GEEDHVHRVAVERIAQHAFINDQRALAGTLGFYGTSEAGGAGADADDVVRRIHLFNVPTLSAKIQFAYSRQGLQLAPKSEGWLSLPLTRHLCGTGTPACAHTCGANREHSQEWLCHNARQKFRFQHGLVSVGVFGPGVSAPDPCDHVA